MKKLLITINNIYKKNKELIYSSFFIFSFSLIGFIVLFLIPIENKLGNVDDISYKINVDGEMIKMEFEDDNSDENIIIKSNKSDYFNLGGQIMVYFSVDNLSGIDQNIDLVFDLKTGDVLEVFEYGGYTEEEIKIETVSATSTSATSTLLELKTNKQIKNIWTKKLLKNPDKYKKENKINNQLLGATEYIKKDIGETDANKYFQDYFKNKERKFYKAIIEIKTSGREKFFLEAFGVEFGYGHLDPFSFTETFDDITTGNLTNDADWWDDAVTGDDIQVQTTIKFKGAKAIKQLNLSQSASRDDSSTSGTVYFAWYLDTTGSSGDGNFFQLRGSGDEYIALIKAVNTGKVQYLKSGGYLDFFTYSEDTWYIFSIEYDASTDKVVYGYKVSGGSWTYTGSLDVYNNFTAINRVRIGQDNTWTGYIDEIAPSDPDSTPPEERRIMFIN